MQPIGWLAMAATNQQLQVKNVVAQSTSEIILALFPTSGRDNASLRELAFRADRFTSVEVLAPRLDALVALFKFLRKPDRTILEPLTAATAIAEPQKSVIQHDAKLKRERVWVSILETSSEVRERYRAGIAAILRETNGVALFAQSGLPNDRGLITEVSDRFFGHILPAPREDVDLSKLFLRLFPSESEVDRFFSLPSELLDRIAILTSPPDDSEAWHPVVECMLGAFCLLGARVQGLGLSENLRVRSEQLPVQHLPFYRLPRAADSLVLALRTRDGAPEAVQLWHATLADCRKELRTIVAHLDSRGVNLDVVYALDVIHRSLIRMEAIIAVLIASVGPRREAAGKSLLREVVRGRIADRSLRSLASNSFRLLARKIVEWAGKTGEHYITSNRAEYFQMWRAALGGGLLTVGTAAIKLIVMSGHMPLFVEGFLVGLDYAVSFVLMQNYHLALATKQPSMTGAALARIIQNCRGAARSDELFTYVSRIFRSQLAAALGNIVAVCAGSLVLMMLWHQFIGPSFLSDETSWHAVESLNPIRTLTVFYAALTGVILWISSIAGGWIENWAVYHRLPEAIAQHRLGEKLQPETLARISNSFSRNIAGWGGSIVLGFMMGMTPVLGKFFGLPLDVRHVTLSTGMLALGTASLGLAAVGKGALIMATLGVAATFVLNLTTSFYLALRLALRAQDVTRRDHLDLLRTLWSHFRHSPRDFFLPPREDAAPPTPEPAL
jgi:site-specific recombinase